MKSWMASKSQRARTSCHSSIGKSYAHWVNICRNLTFFLLLSSRPVFTWTQHCGISPMSSAQVASLTRKERFKNQNISFPLGSVDACASAKCSHAWNSSYSSRHCCIPSMLFFPRDVNNRHLMVIPAWPSTPTISSSIWRNGRSNRKPTIRRSIKQSTNHFERSALIERKKRRRMKLFHRIKVPIFIASSKFECREHWSSWPY